MKLSDQDLVLSAAKCLRLRDISLLSCRFERPTESIPAEVAAEQQNMRHVSVARGELDADDKKLSIAQVRVTLGARVATIDAGDGTEPDIYFVIEAAFLVDYELTAEVSEAELAAFANFNSVHNVWPFWRQHVFDIVQRARLPHLDVPLFSGYKAHSESSDTAP